MNRNHQDPVGRTLPSTVRRAAEEWGEKTFCIFPNGEVSFSEARARMVQFGGALQSLGVGPGDRVAIVMGNRVEWIDAWFGICAIGAIEVPINQGLRGRLLAHCLADSGARIAVVEEPYLDEILRMSVSTPNLQAVIVVGDEPKGDRSSLRMIGFDQLPRGRMEVPEVRLRSPAAIMYTSGTTGPAKGAVLPHNYFLRFGEEKARHLRTAESDRIYNCYPMFNATGQCETTMVALMTGASVVHATRFSAGKFWNDIRSYGCTEFVYMGGILSILDKAKPSTSDAENPVRAAYGVPTPAKLHPAFEERFGCVLIEVYGSTEASAVTYNDYDRRKWGSCGLPTAGFDVRIVDDDDNEVPPNIRGEVIVRSHVPFSMMLGYWNLPERTAESFRGLWYRTGDLAYLDEDGYMFFAGRKAEVIRHRGYMIDPADIELVISNEPEVLEAAVVGIPDEDRGEDSIKVLVVPKSGEVVDLDALLQTCLKELPIWMVPRFWEIRTTLPKTPTQRFEKSELRREGITPDTLDCQDRIGIHTQAAR